MKHSPDIAPYKTVLPTIIFSFAMRELFSDGKIDIDPPDNPCQHSHWRPLQD